MDPNQQFSYPKELIDHIKKRWEKAFVIPPAKKEEIPSDKILQEIFETLYHASFLVEEGRQLNFRVVYTKTQEQHNNDRFLFNKFKNSKPFSLTELLRLAPATDIQKTYIGICSSGDDLEIWGLLDITSSWWDFINGAEFRYAIPPDCLSVSCLGPGHIQVAKSGVVIATLTKGRVEYNLNEVFVKGHIRDFFSHSSLTLDLETSEKQNLSTANNNTKCSNDKLNPYYTEVLNLIIKRILEFNHGGTLLFVTNTDALDSNLTIKYGIDNQSCNTIWSNLKQIIGCEKVLDDFDKKRIDPTLEPTINYKEIYNIVYKIQVAKAQLNDNIRFIASLANVDGAVVIDDHFKVIGFGAEIISPENKNIGKVLECKSLEAADYSEINKYNFGTRHRSAIRFCYSVNPSVALIISQDGGAKAITKFGNDVLMFNKVESESLSL